MTSEIYGQAMQARARGDLAAARELLSRLVRANSADERSQLALGTVCLEQGDAATAVQILYSLSSRYPDNAALLSHYGDALKLAGRSDDAQKVLARARRIEGLGPLTGNLIAPERQNDLDAAATKNFAPPTGTSRHAIGPENVDRPSMRSLATDLDDGTSTGSAGDVRGEALAVWHRRVTSYRRLWLAAVLVLAGVVAKSSSALASRFGENVLLVPIPAGCLAAILAGSAVLSSRFTRCMLYEHRIDVEKGIVSQTRRSIWLFDITSVSLSRPPSLTLTHTAAIDVEHDSKGGKPRTERLIAIASIGDMAKIAEQLRASSLRERRAMKKLWI